MPRGARWSRCCFFYADGPDVRWVEKGRVVADSVGDIRRGLSQLPAGAPVITTYQATVLPIAPGVANVITAYRTILADTTGKGPGSSECRR